MAVTVTSTSGYDDHTYDNADSAHVIKETGDVVVTQWNGASNRTIAIHKAETWVHVEVKQ